MAHTESELINVVEQFSSGNRYEHEYQRRNGFEIDKEREIGGRPSVFCCERRGKVVNMHDLSH